MGPMKGFYSEESRYFYKGVLKAKKCIEERNLPSSLSSIFPNLTSQMPKLSLELHRRDTALDVKKTFTHAKSYCDEGFQAILGCSSSLESIAGRKAAEGSDKTVFLDGISHSNDRTASKYPGFSMFFDNMQSADAIFDEYFSRSKSKKANVININAEYQWSHNQAKSFRLAALHRSEDIKVSHFDVFKTGRSLDRDLVHEIEVNEPKIININLYGEFLVTFLKDLRKSKAFELIQEREITISLPLVTSLIEKNLDLDGYKNILQVKFSPNSQAARNVVDSLKGIITKTSSGSINEAELLGFLQVMNYVNAVVKVGGLNKKKISQALLSSHSIFQYQTKLWEKCHFLKVV